MGLGQWQERPKSSWKLREGLGVMAQLEAEGFFHPFPEHLRDEGCRQRLVLPEAERQQPRRSAPSESAGKCKPADSGPLQAVTQFTY